jgi:dethiobiotin synthetase
MLTKLPIPGLLVTGTDTEVGKTLVAGAIAHWFRRQKTESGEPAVVAVCKPCATGCVHRREGLVSEDAEFLAHCSDTRHPLDVICPQRYAEALAPAIAAERGGEGAALNWQIIDGAIQTMAEDADAMIVEGVGGILTPMDPGHTFLDVAHWLGLPAVVVARPGLGTINHTLMTCAVLRERGIKVAGVVINRYPPETPGTVEETNPRAIERWGKVPVLCLVPEVASPRSAKLPEDVIAAIGTVDWARKAGIEEAD